MASRRSSGANSTRDGADAVGDAFQLVAQGLAQLQEALRLQKQEAQRVVQEALRLQKQEAERKVQEALRLQEERAATALRKMQRKLDDKDAALHALEQRLLETQERLTSIEERTTDSEASWREGSLELLEGRVNEVEASLQSALQNFMPRVDALLCQLKESQPPRASLASAASTYADSAHKTASKGGAAAGGGEGPPSSTSSGAGHQGAAADEEGRARQRVELRVREVKMKMERARTSTSALGEQLCGMAAQGRLSDIRSLIDSGADVNYTYENGDTILIGAAWIAHADVVSLLLQRGADANAVDCYGRSALHVAAWTDRSGRCVELLLRAGADVDARDEDGATPLHYAALYNYEEAVRALLAAGARRDLKSWGGDWTNMTPFDLANSSNIQHLLRL